MKSICKDFDALLIQLEVLLEQRVLSLQKMIYLLQPTKQIYGIYSVCGGVYIVVRVVICI